jgi:LIVCS family branched-chain amino acid:cation transporter
VVITFGLFSLVVSNQGLDQLISVSVPVLVGLYPLAIVLVGLSLLSRLWLAAPRVFMPVMAVALVFGIVDALTAAGFTALIPAFFAQLPLAGEGLGWLLPVLLTLLLVAGVDRVLGKPRPVWA